jgi:putative DNA primase/helicase
MTAVEIGKALGGHPKSRGWMALCPCHEDRTPSLSLDDGVDGRLLVQCFAGCDSVDVLRELDAMGLLPDAPSCCSKPQRPKRRLVHHDVLDLPPNQKALDIWWAAVPIASTPAERYFRHRGITIPIPPSLKFAAQLDYFDGGGATPMALPAVVVAVQEPSRRIVAIQRIYLRPDGRGQAQVSTPKKSLGPISGGAVRLTPCGQTLAVAEGVEDGLALHQMTGQPVWALLGTSAFTNFIPPPEVTTIVLAPDADEAGDEAAKKAASRFTETGLKVLRLRPPDGLDWCDVLVDYEERAAIREYLGDAPRAEAELHAFAEAIGGEINDA